jgi:Bacterial protein of unknown function (DUF937)
MNLVSVIKDQLSGEVLGKLGSLIGESPEKTRSAVGAAIPAVLAGMAGTASKPGGAERLDEAISQSEAARVGATSGLMSGGAGMAERGQEWLRSIMGEGVLSHILSAVGNFSGLGLGSAKSLLGAVAPMVLGALGRHKQAAGLDAGGVAQLLSDQKQNIMSAMPSGLGNLLGSIPGLGSVTQAGSAAVQGAREYASAGADAVRRGVAGTLSAGSGAPSAVRWAIPLALLLGLGVVIWAVARHRGEDPKDLGKVPQAPAQGDAIKASGTIPPSVAADASKVTSSLTEVFASITDTLSNVKDAASADAAIPKLKALGGQIEGMKPLVDKLPASAKSGIMSLVDTWLPKLKEAASKMSSIPGVEERVKPVIDDLMSKVASLKGQ